MVVFITIIGEVTSHKIAIVGGGIGGTSNAFFLQQLLKDKAQIKVHYCRLNGFCTSLPTLKFIEMLIYLHH